MTTMTDKRPARFGGAIATGTLVLIGTLILAGCGPRIEPEGLSYMFKETPIYEESTLAANLSRAAGGNGKGNRVQDFSYTLYQVAQLDPVVVDGVTVQANDIVIEGDTAAIAYNIAGAAYGGAIQVLDLSRQFRPVITAEIAFPDVEIITLELDGSTLYFGGSIHPDGPYTTERSFVAELDLSNLDSETLEADTINNATTFSSFSSGTDYFFTTGIAKRDGEIWASVGADPGAVFKLDETLSATPVVQSEDPEADVLDIRDMESYHGGVIAVAGGNAGSAPNSGRVIVIKGGGVHDNSTITLADGLDNETKATIEVYDRHYAFIGQSNAGFQVVFLKADTAGDERVTESIFSIQNPEVGWSARAATNSASYSGDLVFTANGEAGFRVFQTTAALKRDNPPGSDWLSLIGFVPFDETLQPSGDYWSANHVEFSNDTLFVAAGLGGVVVYALVPE